MNSNDASKLQAIISNIFEKANEDSYYRIELDGRTAFVFKSGAYGIGIEVETSGEFIYIENISKATFDSDHYFAEFMVEDGETHGLNITKEISREQIFAELG